MVSTLPQSCPQVLDLCTGTGLTVLEMGRVVLTQHRKVDIVGLDYNEAMLAAACERFSTQRGMWAETAFGKVRFLRGDATDLVRANGATAGIVGFETFSYQSFDAVTQVFGIGGIRDTLVMYRNILSILRAGGKYLCIDIHQPIIDLPGEYPVPGKWIRTPQFESYTYAHTTIPLALGRLWGWRDPTLDFYLAPLICDQYQQKYWGFRILLRQVQPERWWFGLPVMPTCELLLEKEEIDQKQYEQRLMELEALVGLTSVI